MFPEYVKPSEGGKEKMRRLRTKRAAALFLSAALVLELFGNFGSVTVNAAELFGTAGKPYRNQGRMYPEAMPCRRRRMFLTRGFQIQISYRKRMYPEAMWWLGQMSLAET